MADRAILVEQHSGPRLLCLDGRPEREIVYRYMRTTHNFVTDTNHLISWGLDESGHCSRYLTVWQATDNSGWASRWFSLNWWIVTPEMIEEEMSENSQRRIAILREVMKCRDTVRGRRAKRDKLSLAYEYARQNRILTRRRDQILRDQYWPEVEGMH